MSAIGNKAPLDIPAGNQEAPATALSPPSYWLRPQFDPCHPPTVPNPILRPVPQNMAHIQLLKLSAEFHSHESKRIRQINQLFHKSIYQQNSDLILHCQKLCKISHASVEELRRFLDRLWIVIGNHSWLDTSHIIRLFQDYSVLRHVGEARLQIEAVDHTAQQLEQNLITNREYHYLHDQKLLNADLFYENMSRMQCQYPIPLSNTPQPYHWPDPAQPEPKPSKSEQDENRPILVSAGDGKVMAITDEDLRLLVKASTLHHAFSKEQQEFSELSKVHEQHGLRLFSVFLWQWTSGRHFPHEKSLHQALKELQDQLTTPQGRSLIPIELDETTYPSLHDQDILYALNKRLGMNDSESSKYPEFEMAVLVGKILAINNLDLNDHFPIRETCQMVIRHLEKYGEQYHHACMPPYSNLSSSASVGTDEYGMSDKDTDEVDEETISKMLDFANL